MKTFYQPLKKSQEQDNLSNLKKLVSNVQNVQADSPLIEEENKNEIHNTNQNEIVDKEEDIQAKECQKERRFIFFSLMN